MLIQSGQPEILRAVQRDENFLTNFHESFSEILQRVLGIRTWMKFKETFRVASNLLYYSATTLSNLQTLGEEYTGIFQTHSSGKYLQSKHVQLTMLLLNICGEKVLIDTLKKFEKYIDDLPEDHPLQIHSREKLIRTSVHLRNALPYLQRLHKAVFYINGEYYEFGKRVTSTRYMLVRPWLKDRSTLPAFRLVGIVSFIHIIIHMLVTGMKLHWSPAKQTECLKLKTNESVSNENKCSLCLNNRKNASSITCGHMFCWDCIIAWLQEQPQCPLCRRAVQPSRVVLLQNY